MFNLKRETVLVIVVPTGINVSPTCSDNVILYVGKPWISQDVECLIQII
ncbi:MAG: hypothetical protein R2805_03465 [Flavobacterium sp.]